MSFFPIVPNEEKVYAAAWRKSTAANVFFFGVLQIFSVQPIRALLVENFLSELFRKTLLSSL